MNPDASIKPKAPQPVGIGSSGPPSNPVARAEVSTANIRLTRIVSLLIFLQIILLVAISAWMLQGIDWDAKMTTQTFSQSELDALAAGFWFLLSALLLLPAAIGLMFMRRFAWILAMSIEILLLTLTLINFFWGTVPTLERANRVFLIMGSAVVLVFYLNLEGVRTAVHWRRSEEG